MDVAKLAAKQKRANDWADFIAAGEVQDQTIAHAIEERLVAFRGALKKVWEAETITPADEATLEDLERQLVQLNEEARLRVVGRRSKAGCCHSCS